MFTEVCVGISKSFVDRVMQPQVFYVKLDG